MPAGSLDEVHVTVCAVGVGEEFHLRREIEMVKSALLYADRVTLASPKVALIDTLAATAPASAEYVAALRAAGRQSEIDYERRKAQNRSHPTASPPALSPPALLEQLADVREDAARRGIDFITLRGLAERLGLPGTRLGDLHRHLSSRPHGEYTPPLWSVRPTA